MGTRRAVAILTSAAIIAVGACYDEPEADMEAGAPDATGEMEQQGERMEQQGERMEQQAPDQTTTTRQRRTSLQSFDADESGDLDRDEWEGVWTNGEDVDFYEAREMDGLGEEEWTAYSYSIWDTDNDEVITETEWSEGVDRWFEEDVAAGSWTDWDQDGDSELDLNEMREGVEINDLYDRLDGDSDLILDDEELADWFFEAFDDDEDDRVDVTEWDWTADYDFGSDI